MAVTQGSGSSRLLRVSVRNGGVARTVEVAGELDLATVGELDAEMGPREGFDVVILDLRGLTFMDSTGLKSLIQAERVHREMGSRLVLVRGQRQVQHVFEISGLEQRFEFVDAPKELTSDPEARNGSAAMA